VSQILEKKLRIILRMY